MHCFATLSTFISGKFRCKRIIFKIIQKNMQEVTFSCKLCYCVTALQKARYLLKKYRYIQFITRYVFTLSP